MKIFFVYYLFDLYLLIFVYIICLMIHTFEYWENWVRLFRQFKETKQILNILTIGIMMQGWQILVFQSNNTWKIWSFWLMLWWEKSRSHVLRRKYLKVKKNHHKKMFFRIFWLSGFWCEEQNQYHPKETVETSDCDLK